MMRERKFSSCTQDTGASWESFQEAQDGVGWSRGTTCSWEMETVTSSHDSGFISHPDSASWPLRFPGWPEEKEDGHSKDRRRMENEENNNLEKPDLLDSLIQEDFEERLEEMKQEGASQEEKNFLNNLTKLLELQIQTTLGGDKSAAGPGVGQLSWPRPQQEGAAGGGAGGVRPILGGGRGRSYPAQVSSLNSFIEQEVPLTFPGQLAPVPPGPVRRGQSPATPRSESGDFAPIGEDQRKPGGGRRMRNSESGGGGGQVSREELHVRMGEVAHQLQALVRERKECEQELAQRGVGPGSAQIGSDGSRNSEILKLNKLLGEVGAEHERILVMVRTLEVVNNVVHSKSLHDNLSKWKNITIDLSNMMRFRQRGGEGGLTSEIVRMGQSIRRIRTLLWTLTASLPSQAGLQELRGNFEKSQN